MPLLPKWSGGRILKTMALEANSTAHSGSARDCGPQEPSGSCGPVAVDDRYPRTGIRQSAFPGRCDAACTGHPFVAGQTGTRCPMGDTVAQKSGVHTPNLQNEFFSRPGKTFWHHVPRLPRQFSSIFRAAMKASCGMSTLPNWRIFFLPAFCLSSSLRLREMSPP
jgi:hypothetical protein